MFLLERNIFGLTTLFYFIIIIFSGMHIYLCLTFFLFIHSLFARLQKNTYLFKKWSQAILLYWKHNTLGLYRSCFLNYRSAGSWERFCINFACWVGWKTDAAADQRIYLLLQTTLVFKRQNLENSRTLLLPQLLKENGGKEYLCCWMMMVAVKVWAAIVFLFLHIPYQNIYKLPKNSWTMVMVWAI